MKLNKITNPIYFELIKLNLIKKKKLLKFQISVGIKKFQYIKIKKLKLFF